MTVGLASVISYLVAGFFDSPVVLALAVGLVFLFIVTFGKIWGEQLSDRKYASKPQA
jgi:hypothetical protein